MMKNDAKYGNDVDDDDDDDDDAVDDNSGNVP